MNSVLNRRRAVAALASIRVCAALAGCGGSDSNTVRSVADRLIAAGS